MMQKPLLSKRRGAIAPLTGILAIFILGMVAFAVDTAWIVLTETELQSAADSAALAGANQIMDGYVQYNLPNQTEAQKAAILANAMASARTAAKNYAAYNAAGGVKSLTLLDSDIEFGFMDSANIYTSLSALAGVALPTSSNFNGYPNTVKVTMRRDATANGALNLFFAPAIGTKSTVLTATASATLYGGVVQSFKTESNVGVLPMTYDINDWNNFLKNGKDPDGITSKDTSGNPQLMVYPSIKDTGNFGLLGLDDEHAGSSEVRSWINDGLPPSDVSTLISRNLIPLSAHNPTHWDWLGDTGFRASVVSEVNNYTGKTFMMPLFTPKSGTPSNLPGYEAGVGNGSHYDYNIVAFVGIKIQYTSDTNREIIIQPAAVIEPNVIFQSGTLAPIGTSPNLITAFTTPKLTR